MVFAVAGGFSLPTVEDVLPNNLTLIGFFPYAHDIDGNLVIDISDASPFYPGYGEGLSRNTVYRFDDVIAIKNNASVVCVIVQSNFDGLKFYTDGSADSTLTFSLGENEIVYIGVEINTSLYDLGTYTGSFTIKASEGECS